MIKSTDKLNKMITLLNKKNELLTELKQQTGYQRQFIETDDVDKLNRIIQSKQLKIDKINRLDQEFLNNFDSFKKEYGINQLEEIKTIEEEGELGLALKELKEVTLKVNKLLKEISVMDKDNNDLIKLKYKEIRGKMVKVKQGNKARNNYLKQPLNKNGYFINKKK